MAWLEKGDFVKGERMSEHKELVTPDEIEKLIAEFPIKIGQRVWFVTYYDSKSLRDAWICSGVVLAVTITANGIYVKFKDSYEHNKTYKLGKSVFLTKEEAEERLKDFLTQ
mgnify:FL=1